MDDLHRIVVVQVMRGVWFCIYYKIGSKEVVQKKLFMEDNIKALLLL